MRTETEATLREIVPLLQVSDMHESLTYYQEALGFSVDFVWPDQETPKWARVSRQGVRFMLTIDLGTSDKAFIAEKGNGVVFYILADDIQALYEELQSRGALIVQDLIRYGDRWQFSVADINGYALAFSEPFVL